MNLTPASAAGLAVGILLAVVTLFAILTVLSSPSAPAYGPDPSPAPGPVVQAGGAR